MSDGRELLAAARSRMVDELRALGTSAPTLAALSAVRRELFVPWFFSSPPSAPGRPRRSHAMREWRVDGGDVDSDAVALVYDASRALGIARDEAGRTTSTVSAPVLLASMLDLLELTPGLRVLEIGAGSGYTAALLAEVLGDPALVTTVDIDEQLVRDARDRLSQSGHGGVVVLAGDGDGGAPDHAPYDRIVATVGCLDLSPAWFDQLTPDGFALVPVQHGGVHPLVRARRQASAVEGQVVGRSGFVSIQGTQTHVAAPWPLAGRPGPRSDLRTQPLDLDLAAALRVERGRERLGGIAAWDFDYYLALVDRRSAHLGILLEADGSTAGVDATSGEVVEGGPNGPAVAADLLTHLRTWVELGRPAMGDFESDWQPINADVHTADIADGRTWIIERVHHRQVVRLRPTAP